MRRLLLTGLISFPLFLLFAQEYHAIELETLGCSNHKWQEVEYLVDEQWLPLPKLTGSSSDACLVTGNYGGGEIYNPFYGNTETHAWVGYITPPQQAKYLILQFNDAPVDPDSMRFTKPSYSQVTDFRVWGLGDDDR